jgi:hypothetical protein
MLDWTQIKFIEPAPIAKPRVAEIQAVVSARNAITTGDLRGESRRRRYSWPRQIAMALSREMTDQTYPQIGQAFGKDHTSVIWAYRKVKRLEAQDERFANELNSLRGDITAVVDSRSPPVVIEAKTKPIAYSLRWAERHKLREGVNV